MTGLFGYALTARISREVNDYMRILRGTEVANQLQGHTIVFNNITEVITVDGQPSQSAERRVRATLVPRAKTPDNTPPVMAPTLRTSPGVAPTQKP
jgi:lipopolysaccharide export system protein LptA